MAIRFTDAQQKVLDARNHNILVSAAAGSGKTAVLVERIVRLITEGENPPDIDRLLVVTFTRAAAAQMRERIGDALSKRLREDPGNTHLQRQAVLLHNAQITTIDSFCTFLLRNYFSEIDLDPGFRQIEPAENDIIAADVLEDFLEEKYAEKDPAFLRCVDYFCTNSDDKALVDLIRELWKNSGSHPSPEAWLRERAFDYDVKNEEELFATPWMRSLIRRSVDFLLEQDANYAAMQEICLLPDGPEVLWPFLEEERQGLFAGIREMMRKVSAAASEEQESADSGKGEKTASSENSGIQESADGRIGEKSCPLPEDTETLRGLWTEIIHAVDWSFKRYPSVRGKKYEHYDTSLKDNVKNMREAEKAAIVRFRESIGGRTPEMILAMMESACEPVRTLSSLTLEFHARLQAAKKEKHMIDFVDLEHFALDILAERREDGSYVPRRVAKALRSHFAEILIDEYQDSNEVQELLLQIVSGEDEGRNNRFMVGDIKQSIYRFRLARPEIFMEKYDTYRAGDPSTERIDLDQNFRSRAEVLDSVNAVFRRIMRKEIGGVDYVEKVSLKKGAVFPNEHLYEENSAIPDASPYCTELLLLDTSDPEESSDVKPEASGAQRSTASRGSAGKETSEGQSPEDVSEEDLIDGEDSSAVFSGEISAMTDRQKEALLIAGRIRRIVGALPVRDDVSGKMRPARYGDIVILLRSTVGWIEDLRAVFQREGIPAYAESRTGYFAAEEIRVLLNMLRVLDNPLQDIPLYSALRGFFGNFTQDEISLIHLVNRKGALFDALCAAAGEDPDSFFTESDDHSGDTSVPSVGGVDSPVTADDDVDPHASHAAGVDPHALSAAGVDSPVAPDGDVDPHASHAAGVDSPVPPALAAKCADFLAFLKKWRERIQFCSVTEIVNSLLEETGYQDYCTALPGGAQRSANLRLLQSQADSFAKTEFTGLFQFLRFIDGVRKQEIDYGEANTLDEKADVVRIMTIHKSKGLEFPVCIVAGLSGGFSFRHSDASGQMIFDSDLGVGIHYFDVTSRVRASTLRREEIAEKIRRDAMGEELRVLYVAMTRAKEKLILTASKKNLKKKAAGWITGMTGFYSLPEAYRLSPFMISKASCFAELICKAVMAQLGKEASDALFTWNPPEENTPFDGGSPLRGDITFERKEFMQAEVDTSAAENSVSGQMQENVFPMSIRTCTIQDLTLQAAAEQLDLSRCDEILRGLEGHPLAEQPDPEAARVLADRYFRVYPHEELRDLYAQTSVSELKHRAMQAAYAQMEEGTAQGAVEVFPDETPVPYLPAFIRKELEKTPDPTGTHEGLGTESGSNRSVNEIDPEHILTGSGKDLSLKSVESENALESADFLPDFTEEAANPNTPSVDSANESMSVLGSMVDSGTEPMSVLGSLVDSGVEHDTNDRGREQAREAAAAGARRGTAFHRALELLDYSQRDELIKKGAAGISEWIAHLAESGIMSGEDAGLVSIRQLQRFLRSRLAGRMEAADRAGLLFREQPFVLGCSADRVEESLPKEETVMVQGIIDAFFVENGRIFLVDYKTDRVRSAQELKMRYSTQLSLYAEALGNAYEVPVAEKIIYSTALGKEILL